MMFYRNILSQNLFTYLPCCFIETLLTNLVHQPTMLFYRNILSQNLFSYFPCCFYRKHFVTKLVNQPIMLFYRNILITKLVHLPTVQIYRNILSPNLFTYLPWCFIKTFGHKICSLTYHAVLSQHFVTKI